MADLTQTELKNLKNIIIENETIYQKLQIYTNQVQDAQIKQLFNNAMQEALNTKQQLMSFLNN